MDDEADPRSVKECCSAFYEADLVRRFLGDSFHPGGERITERLGEALGLDPGSLVLDVACGAGASAIALAEAFGCRVVGVDLSEANLERARARADELGLGRLLAFQPMDAEGLGLRDASFDAVVSECALCTFPDKPRALAEAYRVLRPGGRVGLTDVVVERELPERVQGLLFHVACISGALPARGYVEALEAAGFSGPVHEDHGHAIRELLERGERLLMGWGVIERLYGIDLEGLLGLSRDEAKGLLSGAFRWLDEGAFSYGLFVADRPGRGMD